MPSYFRKCLCLLLLVGGLLCGACHLWEDERPKNDLDLAEEAVRARDIGDAEMFFERYLRKNPTGEHRWYVWQQLLNISLSFRQDKGTAKNYLTIMLMEYAEEPLKRREIQRELASICDELRLHEEATELWEALVADPDTPPEDKAAFSRKLSHAYLRRLEFAMATDMLDLCLKLDVSPSTKADCLYDVGEAQMLTGELESSEKALRTLLDIPEADAQRRVLATFMLADVFEQRQRTKEAVELFESIRETYPNSKVIDMRITALRGKRESRQPDVIPKKR